MSVAIGASASGGRAYTATASQGLLYMVEALYNAAGLGLPSVMTGGPTGRSAHRSTSGTTTATRCRSGTPAGSSCTPRPTNRPSICTSQAFRLAEELSTPVMVCMDGFVLDPRVQAGGPADAGAAGPVSPPRSGPRQALDLAGAGSRSAPWSARRRSPRSDTLPTPRSRRALERESRRWRPSSRPSSGGSCPGLVDPYRAAAPRCRGGARLGVRHGRGSRGRAASRRVSGRGARPDHVPAVPDGSGACLVAAGRAASRARARPRRRVRRRRVHGPAGVPGRNPSLSLQSWPASAAGPSPGRRCATVRRSRRPGAWPIQLPRPPRDWSARRAKE